MTSIFDAASQQPSASTPPSNEAAPRGPSPFTRAQGYVLILLTLAAVGLAAWAAFKPAPKYAYKVVSVQAQFTKDVSGDVINKENAANLTSTSVDIKDEQLTVLGQEGWELVGTLLEIETTHPNFGSSQYVTGLQPNIRPQKAVLLFKKQL